MKTKLILVAIAALTVSAVLPPTAGAVAPISHRRARRNASTWHSGYYHTMWGQPVALVVPPTAELQTHWSWGVAQTRVTPIWSQYERPYPGPYTGGAGFAPTPRWPSHTDQFGVYYVRGPW